MEVEIEKTQEPVVTSTAHRLMDQEDTDMVVGPVEEEERMHEELNANVAQS